METRNRFGRLLLRSSAVRSIVRFAERNHLTKRSREDIFYYSRPILEEPDSVLACFVENARVAIRPKNSFRRLAYDWRQMKQPNVVHITANLEVRNKFRNLRAGKFMDGMERMTTAPSNNHGEFCAARNVASQTLAATDWGGDYLKFSLSGSRQELEESDAGYRGHHQATDFAHSSVHDRVLTCAPELLKDPRAPRARWVVISTDTINHIPIKERNAILSNGIPLISYTSTPILTNPESIDAPRTCVWKGNKLLSHVNGGGDYCDQFDNSTADVKVVDSPDGGLMLCYIDSFRDAFDPSHIFSCETPFAYVARDTTEYRLFKDAARPDVLHPYVVTSDIGEFSCLSIRHSDVIQITDNLARTTHFYKRAELLEMAGKPLTFKTKTVLKRDPPIVFGRTPDYADRYRIIERLGTDVLVAICQCSPQVNLPRPPADDRRTHRVTMLYLAMLGQRTPIEEMWKDTDRLHRHDIYQFFDEHGLVAYLPSDAEQTVFGRVDDDNVPSTDAAPSA